MSKETFERYRKGARFERVKENFENFCRLKHERRAKVQIVLQLVRLEGNAHEAEEFVRYWSAVPGVDLVRIKEDETNLLRPEAGHAAEEWKHPCHYLWRGPLYIKHNGDVYPCCQSYMLDGAPVGRVGERSLDEIFDGEEMRRMRRLHVAGRAGEIGVCARCCTTIPHPLLVAGSLLLHGKTVRRLLPWVERMVYLARLPQRWLKPPAPTAPKRPDLVRIEPKS
jgi:radical SAM protein with 4Fe4S-binding SPASM domain